MVTTEELRIRCERIREKLKRFDELDPDSWFDGHIELQPPLEEAEIAAFETQHGITLPLDYRTFLLHVAAGGTGPGYGLKPLGCFEHATHVAAPQSKASDKLLPADFLRTPFPHRDWWQPLPEIPLSDEATDEEYQAWAQQNDKQRTQHLYPIHFVTGTLTLSHFGCGIFDFLVITGDERGHMWRDDRINMEALYPSSLEEPLQDENYEEYDHVTYIEGQRISFLDWYEGWLNNVLYFAENHLNDEG